MGVSIKPSVGKGNHVGAKARKKVAEPDKKKKSHRCALTRAGVPMKA